MLAHWAHFLGPAANIQSLYKALITMSGPMLLYIYNSQNSCNSSGRGAELDQQKPGAALAWPLDSVYRTNVVPMADMGNRVHGKNTILESRSWRHSVRIPNCYARCVPSRSRARRRSRAGNHFVPMAGSYCSLGFVPGQYIGAGIYFVNISMQSGRMYGARPECS